jgi:hypothetical protein
MGNLEPSKGEETLKEAQSLLLHFSADDDPHLAMMRIIIN